MTTYLDSVAAELQTRFAAATGVAIPFRVGEKARHQHHSPPAICWAPRSGKIDPARSTGRNGAAGREIRDRTQELDVYLYASTAEQSEAMHMAFVAFIAGTACRGIDLGEWEWLTESEAGAGWVSQEGTIRQRVTLHQPVFREGHDLREIMTAPLDAPNDGQDFASLTDPTLAAPRTFVIGHAVTPDGDFQ